MKTLIKVAPAAAILTMGFALSSYPADGAAASESPNAVKYADVQKVFNRHCLKCHDEHKSGDAIILTSFEMVMKGGKDGKIVIKGDASKSPLFLAISGAPGHSAMPPKGRKLSAKDIHLIQDWIESGAEK